MTVKIESLCKPMILTSPSFRLTGLRSALGRLGRRLGPCLLALTLVIGVWQFVCMQAGSALPPPSKVVTDTWPLIAHPFDRKD